MFPIQSHVLFSRLFMFFAQVRLPGVVAFTMKITKQISNNDKQYK